MATDMQAPWTLPVLTGCKGLPLAATALRLEDIGAQGWNLLAGDLPTPVAVLKSSALAHNLTTMQAYLDRAGVRLAPHGKTTMCPQLYARQIGAGAWGITVATFAQARVAIACGVRNLLIANELVGEAEIEGLAQLQREHPELELYSLVDSVAGLERLHRVLQRHPGQPPFRVLLEIGFPGGRCGCRSVEEAMAVARAAAALPTIALSGIEGYEGLIVSADRHRDAVAVDAYLQTVIDVFQRCASEQLFAKGPVLLSAGGSAYFDLVARALASVEALDLLPIVRSGCYLTHDAGFYKALVANVAERAVLGEAPDLRSALEVWTQVLSRPEPDLVILNAGKRDVSFDIDLPFAHSWFRAQESAPQPLAQSTVLRLSDQHAFLRVPADSPLQVGDFVGLSISHPCTTFDKWQVLLEVDDDYNVIEALRTYF